MKFLPLVWAAVMRKPTRAILTLLSVMLAFTLFGLTIGMNATFAKSAGTGPRRPDLHLCPFSARLVPMALARQIENMPGVEMVAGSNFIASYIRDPKKTASSSIWGQKIPKIMAEWPDHAVTQWQMITKMVAMKSCWSSGSQAERWHLKAGDTLTIAAPTAKKPMATPVGPFMSRL